MTTKQKRSKLKLAWGGFWKGNLHTWISLDTGNRIAVYKTRKEARLRFEDVRRIAIRERR